MKGGTDLKFILQIIDEIDRTYNIDRGRIYATGHSNGGYRHNGAHYLAVRDLVGSYAKRNGCGYPPRVTHIRGGERHVYPCARKELQLILNPQNHTWNRVPDASQEVWNFLSRQRL